MKIVVMWEDPSEEEAARNLTDVLPRIAPSLANAAIDSGGGVSIRYNASQPITVRARCCPDSDDLGIRELREEAAAIAKQLAAQTQIPPAIMGREPRTVKRAWGGQIVRGGDVKILPDDYEYCPRCGEPKYIGAYCVCDPRSGRGEYPIQQVEAKPAEPPSETRDLIFPDEDE